MMMLGDRIDLKHEEYIFHLITELIKMIGKVRKDIVFPAITELGKKINYFDNVLRTNSIVIKIALTKITNVKKNDIASVLESNRDKKCFIVFDSITPKAYEELTKYDNCSPFFVNDILSCSIESTLQSDFHLLNKEERDHLFDSYNVTESQLPKMKKSDIICRIYGALPGDVFKVVRYSVTNGDDVYYRIVVNSSNDDLFI